jgi:hypothetical protein
MAYYTSHADVTIDIGMEHVIKVRNNTGATIPNGKAVYITGGIGHLPTIALAHASSSATARAVGLSTHDLLNNENGFITTDGEVHGLDMSA